jgi:hypothetical protein
LANAATGSILAVAPWRANFTMLLKLLSIVLGITGLAWLALLFSSRALLVTERIEKALLHERLVCVYFSGTRTLRKEFWYSQDDMPGRSACPRWERVRLAPEH